MQLRSPFLQKTILMEKCALRGSKGSPLISTMGLEHFSRQGLRNNTLTLQPGLCCADCVCSTFNHLWFVGVVLVLRVLL